MIQSGIDAAGKCTKTDCVVNFRYDPKSSKEACHWDFQGGSYTAGIENSCNPGYIHYPVGNFSVTLRVYERGNDANFRDKVLNFSNPAPVAVSGGGSTIPASAAVPVSVSILEPVIVVQSGLDSASHCTKTDCSVNLEYKVLGPKEACHWDFSGGSYTAGTENKCNPGYIHYPTGEFSVTLRVYEQGNILNFREKTLKIANVPRVATISEQAGKKSPENTFHENHAPHAAIKLQ